MPFAQLILQSLQFSSLCVNRTIVTGQSHSTSAVSKASAAATTGTAATGDVGLLHKFTIRISCDRFVRDNSKIYFVFLTLNCFPSLPLFSTARLHKCTDIR
jgi:hypothetical protein